MKKFPEIGACGIDCGLCPTYYTKGPSKCPGCGGPEFPNKHPSCSILRCVSNKKFETCADCEEFPCEKVKRWDGGDSFVTHKMCLQNLENIKKLGIENFLRQQRIRMEILDTILREYNEGRSKSFYCLASTLLPLADLRKALIEMEEKIKTEDNEDIEIKEKSTLFKKLINQRAQQTKIDLKLRKP